MSKIFLDVMIKYYGLLYQQSLYMEVSEILGYLFMVNELALI